MSIQQIPLDKIDRMQPARKLDLQLVKRLAKSITQHDGLFQPVGLVPDGDRYRLIWGNHRLEACILAGRNSIESRLLPPDTTPDQELAYSLQENHLRAEEDIESTLVRVEAYATAKKCSFAKAANAVGVSKSYVSKAQKIVQSLGPQVMKLAREHKVGISILYAIAKASDAQQQLELLAAYIDGSMNRTGIEQASKRTTGRNKQRSLSLKLVIDDMAVKLNVPDGTGYEQLIAMLTNLKRHLATHRKNGIPCKLLPEVMNGGN